MLSLIFFYAWRSGRGSVVFVIAVIGVGLFVPIPFFLAFVTIPSRRGKKLRRVGVRVTGECVRISWDENASISTIKYSTRDGRKFIHRTIPNYSRPIEPGSEVEIVYDPDAPSRARVAAWLDGEPGQSFTTRAMLVIEGIFLIPQVLWIYVILYNIF
ncbi:DUF3592 domain-containing protein [Streptomyces sp. NPDC000405]|uniref:DUF3592 domain-containing protein n=1 Tax=Streptomyces sp. NPDC000405 TaxID=3161033 RepID=UPI00398D1417